MLIYISVPGEVASLMVSEDSNDISNIDLKHAKSSLFNQSSLPKTDKVPNWNIADSMEPIYDNGNEQTNINNVSLKLKDLLCKENINLTRCQSSSFSNGVLMFLS